MITYPNIALMDVKIFNLYAKEVKSENCLYQGSLGNQMFQYAFYKALHHRFSGVYVFYKNLHGHNGYEMERLFGIHMRELPFIWRVGCFRAMTAFPKYAIGHISSNFLTMNLPYSGLYT